MKRFFAVFRKYWKLYGVFVRNSIMSQMEYRTNFFMSALVQLAHMLTKLTYVLVIYKVDQPINGITPDEMLIMIEPIAPCPAFLYPSFCSILMAFPGKYSEAAWTATSLSRFLYSLSARCSM